MTTADDLKARVLEAARAAPSPTRTKTRWRLWLALALGGAAMLSVFLAIGGVRLTERPLWVVALTAGGATAMAFVALVLAIGRGASMLGRPTATLVWLLIATPLLLFGWKLTISTSCELAEWWPDRPGLRCLMWTTLMGSGLLASVLFARRRTVTSRPALLGATIGVAVGALAWVLADLWCPVGHAAHLAVGHVLPLAILGGLGAIAGHLVLPVRA